MSRNFDALAIGNIGLDHVYKVDRIPVNDKTGLILHEKTYLGGRATNVGVTLGRLGLRVAIASFTGVNFAKNGYRDFLVRNHVNVDKVKVIRRKKFATTRVFYTEKGDMVYFFDPFLRDSSFTLDLDKKDIETSEILYVTPFDGEKSIEKVIRIAKDTKTVIVVAIGEEVYRKGANFLEHMVGTASHLLMNEGEFQVLLKKVGLSNGADLFSKNERLDCVAVTLGCNGSILYARSATHEIQPVFPSKIVNSLGAGDAYAAGYIYGLHKKFDLQECGKMGSIAASFALEEEGAQSAKINIQRVMIRYKNVFGNVCGKRC